MRSDDLKETKRKKTAGQGVIMKIKLVISRKRFFFLNELFCFVVNCSAGSGEKMSINILVIVL